MTSISDKNCTNKDVMESYLYLQKTQKKRTTLRTCYTADWSPVVLVKIARTWGNGRGTEDHVVGIAIIDSRRRPEAAETASTAEGSAFNVTRVNHIVWEMTKPCVHNSARRSRRTTHILCYITSILVTT